MAQAWDNNNMYTEPAAPVQNASNADKTTTALAAVLTAAAVLVVSVFSYIFISRADMFDYSYSYRSYAGGGGGGGSSGGGSTGYIPSATDAPISTPTAAPTSAPTAAPTIAPTAVPTPAPTQNTAAERTSQGVEMGLQDPYYSRYENSTYGFSCIYPQHFEPYDDGKPTLFSARSPGGTAIEIIDAKSAAGRSVESELNAYISSVGGVTDFKNMGDDYYAVSQIAGDTSYYKYCKFANGNMYSFEFISPLQQDRLYSRYIETIYSEFIVN